MAGAHHVAGLEQDNGVVSIDPSDILAVHGSFVEDGRASAKQLEAGALEDETE